MFCSAQSSDPLYLNEWCTKTLNLCSIEIKNSAKSTISGSQAAHSIFVVPRACVAAIITFAVAKTEEPKAPPKPTGMPTQLTLFTGQKQTLAEMINDIEDNIKSGDLSEDEEMVAREKRKKLKKALYELRGKNRAIKDFDAWLESKIGKEEVTQKEDPFDIRGNL